MVRSKLVTLDDIVSFSDAQLAEFMDKHRRLSGGFDLPLDGWEKLSAEERNQLADRLTQGQYLAESGATSSPGLDFEQLDARLRELSNSNNIIPLARPRAQRCETESPPDEGEMREEAEREAYNSLVEDGGRPLYSIQFIGSVSRDPEAYYGKLRPFWRKSRPWAIFQSQLERRKDFRNWQLDNRGVEEKNDGFQDHVARVKRKYMKLEYADGLAKIEADPSYLQRPGSWWDSQRKKRKWQRRYQRELGCAGFSDYEKALTTRLARHGFTRPFQLAEDPNQQDKLTTWIEYLGFEYWWLDRYTASVKRLKPKHDEAWEELRKLRILEDDETPEFVRTDASATRRQGDKDRAWKAVQDAESEAEKVFQKTQKNPSRLSIPKEQRIQMLVEARKRLLSAREAHDFVKRRSHLIIGFVRGTFDYDDAKEDVANQINLVEWAVEEAHKIEAEQKSATLESSSLKKRKVSNEDVSLVQSDLKRQKSTAQTHSPQPSSDKISARDRRALRRRNRASIDINRQLGPDQSHSIHDTYPSQTKLVGWAMEQVPLTEAEPESGTSKSSSRKRRKVAFEDDPPIQLSPKRLKPSAQGHGSQASNNGVGAIDRRALRLRNRATADLGHQLDPCRAQDVQDANSSSQSPAPNIPSRELTKGLRRSSRIAALRPGVGIPSGRKNQVLGNLGSEYSPVEELLEKRIRRRGRGCIPEYLVKFKVYDGSFILWTSARELPKIAIDALDQFVSG